MKVVRLRGVKFPNKDNTVRVVVSGYAIYDEDKGYFAISSLRDAYGCLAPYMPCGGKRVLETVISSGWVDNMPCVEWVNSCD